MGKDQTAWIHPFLKIGYGNSSGSIKDQLTELGQINAQKLDPADSVKGVKLISAPKGAMTKWM